MQSWHLCLETLHDHQRMSHTNKEYCYFVHIWDLLSLNNRYCHNDKEIFSTTPPCLVTISYLKGSKTESSIWAAESAKRVSNAETGLKWPIRSQMLNEKGSKCWKGSQISNKVSNVEWKGSQILKRVSNNEYALKCWMERVSNAEKGLKSSLRCQISWRSRSR